MTSDLLQPGPQRWLSGSVFSSAADDYVSYLRQGGYRPNSVRLYLACVAHFAKWVSEEGLGLTQIDEEARQIFLDVQLPHCTCPQPVRRQRHELHAAIDHLLHVLRAQGQIPAAEHKDPISQELMAFDNYMRDVGGLAETTRRQRTDIVRRFLRDVFVSGAIDPNTFEPAHIR